MLSMLPCSPVPPYLQGSAVVAKWTLLTVGPKSKGAGKSGGDGSGVEESKGEEKEDTKSDKATAPSAGAGEDDDDVL